MLFLCDGRSYDEAVADHLTQNKFDTMIGVYIEYNNKKYFFDILLYVGTNECGGFTHGIHSIGDEKLHTFSLDCQCDDNNKDHIQRCCMGFDKKIETEQELYDTLYAIVSEPDSSDDEKDSSDED